MKLIENLQKYASGRHVLLLFIITMIVYFIILFYSIPAVIAQAPGMRLFDMSPRGYTPTYAETLLKAIGPIGRELYLKRQLPIDFIYPGLFAVTYTLMLVWLFAKRFDAKSKIFLLVLVPAAAGLFDYLENFGIILMLKSFPTISPTLVHVSSMFTILKSVLTITFYLLLCYGFILLFVKRKLIQTASK
jgi:hypothetical protein